MLASLDFCSHRATNYKARHTFYANGSEAPECPAGTPPVRWWGDRALTGLPATAMVAALAAELPRQEGGPSALQLR